MKNNNIFLEEIYKLMQENPGLPVRFFVSEDDFIEEDSYFVNAKILSYEIVDLYESPDKGYFFDLESVKEYISYYEDLYEDELDKYIHDNYKIEKTIVVFM